MKKTTLFIVIGLLNATVLMAQPPAGNASVGDFYGKKTTKKNAIAIKKIPAMLNSNESFDTKVKAKVLEVCTKKGCWLKVAVNDSTTALVKMKDYAFFLPSSIVGKNIILDGKANLSTTSVEELKHYAEDANKSKEEIAAITAPKKEVGFLASGILVVK